MMLDSGQFTAKLLFLSVHHQNCFKLNALVSLQSRGASVTESEVVRLLEDGLKKGAISILDLLECNPLARDFAGLGVDSLTLADPLLFPMCSGHSYFTHIGIGVYETLTPAVLLAAICQHPRFFPIMGDRPFEVGQIVTLRFFCAYNPVKVLSIDSKDPMNVSMLLEAVHVGGRGHFFNGTALHSIKKNPSNNKIAYEVTGENKQRERCDRMVINKWFGNHMWRILVQENVRPLAWYLEHKASWMPL